MISEICISYKTPPILQKGLNIVGTGSFSNVTSLPNYINFFSEAEINEEHNLDRFKNKWKIKTSLIRVRER